MSRRFTTFTMTLAVLAVIAAAMTVPLVGQAPSTEIRTWTPGRTPDGQPDIQGVWNFATATPMERPATLGEREFLTPEQEAEVIERRRREDQEYDARREGDTGTYNQFWIDRGTGPVSSKRTSLIIDPPDGRFPALTPLAGQRTAAKKAGRQGRGPADSWEDRNVGERCVVAFNTGYPMIPRLYNNNIQIVQSPGYVAIVTEQIHSARIVPLDGRPHLTSSVRQWRGDSRGRWEGNTLVVETTNFTDKHAVGRVAEPSIRGFNAEPSESYHLTERFTRTAPDTLVYQFTVNDPAIWTRPWTAEIPMTRESQIYEYACHEGNQSMVNILAGARAEEKAAKGGSTR